jgi:xylulokinase
MTSKNILNFFNTLIIHYRKVDLKYKDTPYYKEEDIVKLFMEYQSIEKVFESIVLKFEKDVVVDDEYLDGVLEFCLGKNVILPKIVDHEKSAGVVRADLTDREIHIGAGMGDNAGAAQGLGLTPGKFAVSLGTSGTVFGSFKNGVTDQTGVISGFADAEGNYLPLVCTLNAARVIEWGADLLGVSLEKFGELALEAEPGSGGVVVTPYLEGERTPNLPDATASVTGITLLNGNRETFARACIEGMLNGLRFGGDVIMDQGQVIDSIALIGGAAANQAVRQIAQEIFKAPVTVPEPAEYVALGAAKQAANLK